MSKADGQRPPPWEVRMRRFWAWLIIGGLMSAPASADDLHVRSFDLAWRTVYETHYDPTFGGLNWPAMGDRYRPRAAAARNLTEFNRITNRMLFELKLSHLLVGTPADLRRYLPTVMSAGAIGVTLRLLDGSCAIAAVEPGSPAWQAGLRPGYVLTAIDGRPVTDLMTAALQDQAPPDNRRNRENIVTRFLLAQVQGPPGTVVRLAWQDGNGRSAQGGVTRASTGPGVRLVDFLPPYHLQFSCRLLRPKIAYVRFNHFAPPVDRQLVDALAQLPPQSGLIVDLRGTPGGYLRSLEAVAGMLVDDPVVLYRLQLRDGIVDRKPFPAARVYPGPVAVLIDALSLSASEILAGCLQQLGRATIVGARSPGYVLTANWIELPNGAFLMHTIGRNFMPDGTILENTGVIPDIEAALDRRALLEGRDTQIEAAVKAVQVGLDRLSP